METRRHRRRNEASFQLLIAKTPLDPFFVFPAKHYLDWIPGSII